MFTTFNGLKNLSKHLLRGIALICKNITQKSVKTLKNRQN